VERERESFFRDIHAARSLSSSRGWSFSAMKRIQCEEEAKLWQVLSNWPPCLLYNLCKPHQK
jgi:hypothetical protein